MQGITECCAFQFQVRKYEIHQFALLFRCGVQEQIVGPLETFDQHMVERMNGLIEGLSSGTDLTVINKNKESFEQVMRMLIADAYRV